MKFDELLNAKLLKDGSIDIKMHKSTGPKATSFCLYVNAKRMGLLKIEEQRETQNHFIFHTEKLDNIIPGNEYQIFDNRNLNCYVDTSVLMTDEKYTSRYYSSQVLGAHYHKYRTTFRLFSPLANNCWAIVNNNGVESMIPMEKDKETGVFTGFALGDLDGASYLFMVRIDGQLKYANDPYCYGLTGQSINSIIINPERAEVDLKQNCLKPLGGILNSIIYELSVRDMTSCKNTSIIHKGKFLGLCEEGCTSDNDVPVGIDYIKSLGVTHVQILPCFDFCTGSDYNEEDVYNWGYDPLFYNTPEGSYSTDANDPYCRIIEMKKMIAKFHESGIRVVMDVVYNHVFNKESNAFDVLCPNYYFRFNQDGTLSNGSYCGNDFNSSNPMGRKFVIDSCLHWVKDYGIDGLRFDLMGILDVETINTIYEKCKEINPDFIVYGEGWDMPSATPPEKRAKMQNFSKMPSIGFFNDRFRDTVKGKSSDYELYVKGYLTGDSNYIDGFKHCFGACVLPIAFPPLFLTPSQSINYIECHDNATLYDKLKVSNSSESEEQIQSRIKLINAVNILSFGVPFIHAGQEFGTTKHGHNNSYNAGDEINGINYSLRDKRLSMVEYLKDIIALKKKYHLFISNDCEKIENNLTFENLPNKALMIKYHDEKSEFKPYEDVYLVINPNTESVKCKLPVAATQIWDKNGKMNKKLTKKEITVQGISLSLYLK